VQIAWPGQPSSCSSVREREDYGMVEGKAMEWWRREGEHVQGIAKKGLTH
jgi:hypothetical protein